ncbi:MAG: hypothetical protein K1Y36_27850, partial [Blastocatellia bacterium]|nr:hypothetical protein [Blastocatellia bacterium]
VFFVILASNSSCIRIVDGYSFFFNGLQHFSQQLMHQCRELRIENQRICWLLLKNWFEAQPLLYKPDSQFSILNSQFSIRPGFHKVLNDYAIVLSFPCLRVCRLDLFQRNACRQWTGQSGTGWHNQKTGI